MNKILLLFSLLLTGVFVFGQNPTATIVSPENLTEPYALCLNTEVEFAVDTSNISGIYMYDKGWSTCTEMPDFEGWSNSYLWNDTWITDTSYTHTITGELYVWYTTVVSGGFMGVELHSNVIHIQLNGEIPTIVYSDTVFCDGSTLDISASVTGLGDGKYKWYKDAIEIENETSESLSISEPGSYAVAALSNEAECPDVYYTSESVNFHLIQPEISGTFKPDLGRVTLETSIDYSSFQWKQATSTTSDFIHIENANSYNYNASISSDDLYYAVEIVTTDGCVATSNSYLINDSLYALPEITQPEDTFLCRFDYTTLTLENQAYKSYQWYKDGVAVWNATNPSFEVGANYPGGSGSYTVKVSTELDPENEFESNAITLTFAEQPNIGIKDNAELCPGGSVTLEAKPGWNGEVGGYDSYQWFFNDMNDISSAVEIAGATDSVLEIDVPNETRYYWVKTSLNGCEDESYSKNIQEFALYAPYISMTPWDGKICLGDTVTLKVYSNDVTYQWYFNGEVIEGATEQEYKATEVGYYDIEIASTICETAEPVMNNDSVTINYKFTPTYSVDPEGEQYGENPNHRIFCSGDTVSLIVNNAANYNAYQWYGKLYSPTSTSDEFVPLEGITDSVYTFINGENDKLHYKVRVDSIMDNDEICTAFTDYKTIDGWVFQSPAIASYGNSELCDEGDSTLLHIAFPGDWAKFEWYVDGELAEGFDNDTAWANYEGMWTVTAYPNLCPTIPHSSGVGPYVKFMPEAEIWEDDTVIYAMPLQGMYDYQWYYNDEPINMDTLTLPTYIPKRLLKPGSYVVEVTNPSECMRISDPYVVVGINNENNGNTNIYPNPFTNELTLEFNSITTVDSYEIYNANGQLISKEVFIKASQKININTNSKGIFLIKVNYNDNTSEIHKVVKN